MAISAAERKRRKGEGAKRLRLERIAANLCASCGKRPPVEEAKLCGECQARDREVYARRAAAKKEQQAGCVHRWLLDSPAPGKDRVGGVCKNCGAKQDWPAYEDEIGIIRNMKGKRGRARANAPMSKAARAEASEERKEHAKRRRSIRAKEMAK